MLCKHEVTGSIPVSSTKSRSCFPIGVFASIRDINPEADSLQSELVSTASGRDLKAQALRLTMFENEMNWVTHQQSD